MKTRQGREAFAAAFRLFLDPGNYAIDFHCIAGQDRTGTLSFILLALLGVGLIGHCSGWSLYDRYFGYSAFDPFVTIGAKGWIGTDAGQVGPSVGLGAYYHLDDHWSLRADADVTLGLDPDAEVLHTISCGVQYAF